MNTLNIHQIRELLPHRYPMLLVDRVLDWEAGKKITAIKNVTANEEFFNGHFPNHPVMPGVLIIEALARQRRFSRSCPLTANWTRMPSFISRRSTVPVSNGRSNPGDQLVMEAELVRSSRGMWKFRTKGMVDGQLAVEAELMCAIRGGVVAQKAEA